MKYTKIPSTTFQQLQLNAGVLLANFVPSTGEVSESDILGATTGGVSFSAVPSFLDLGDDIDNCPKNMKELKKLDTWEVKMSGTYLTVNSTQAKSLIAAADIAAGDNTKIVPRVDVKPTDFADIWWVGDYSDENGENGGYMAVRMMNALSTGGFQIKSADKAKGQFAFEYTAHFSMDAQETVPFEVYIKAGSEA